MNKLNLSDKQKRALEEIKTIVGKKVLIDELLLFGSVARDENYEESDMDVLLITKKPINHQQKHEIYAIATETNLNYDTNISLLILDVENWNNGMYSILPIKEEILEVNNSDLTYVL